MLWFCIENYSLTKFGIENDLMGYLNINKQFIQAHFLNILKYLDEFMSHKLGPMIGKTSWQMVRRG